MIAMQMRRESQNRGIGIAVMFQESVNIQLRIEQALVKTHSASFFGQGHVVFGHEPTIQQAVSAIGGREGLNNRHTGGVVVQVDGAAPQVFSRASQVGFVAGVFTAG